MLRLCTANSNYSRNIMTLFLYLKKKSQSGPNTSYYFLYLLTSDSVFLLKVTNFVSTVGKYVSKHARLLPPLGSLCLEQL